MSALDPIEALDTLRAELALEAATLRKATNQSVGVVWRLNILAKWEAAFVALTETLPAELVQRVSEAERLAQQLVDHKVTIANLRAEIARIQPRPPRVVSVGPEDVVDLLPEVTP